MAISKDFWLGKYEVTQEQYQLVMGRNPSHNKQGGKYPVEKVTWNDAKKFCKRLTEAEQKAGRLPKGYVYDLPTEAQWEYAAKGGSKSRIYELYQRYYNFSGSNNIDQVAWYDANSDETTHPVGMKDANELGFHDMTGNVWEWCQDWYGSYEGDATDPKGPASGQKRVNRGGGWTNMLAEECRSSSRSYDPPDYCMNCLGFRVALVPCK